MPSTKRCNGKNAQGERCGSTPRGDSGLCLWHDPDLVEVANEARRAGGLKRKKEAAVRAAYDVDELDSIADVRRVVEIAVTDLLGMDSTIQRNRTLLVAAQVAARLLEAGEFEQRLEAIESVLGERLPQRGKRP